MKLAAGLIVLLLAATAAPRAVRPSAAVFVAASANPAQTFASAADFNTVAVAMTDPGTPLHGGVTLSATAASDRGIVSVTFQSARAGSQSWTNACVATTAPYTCTWDTTAVPDGLVDVRAVALDAAGYSRSDVVSARRVDNTAPLTSLADPGAALSGTVALSASASDAGTGVASAAVQERPTGSGGSWTTICAVLAGCSWNTTTVADGLYDLRVTATDGAGNTGTTTVASRRVDNTAPTGVSLSDPGAAVRGAVTLQATATDGGSGVASIRYEYRTSPAGAWTTACTGSTAPFSCSWTTSGVADGAYDLRATATDAVGNATTSAVVGSRSVDNTAPTGVTLTNPGALLQGTITLLGAGVDATSGIASVRFQYAPAGTTTWTAACTATTAPYSCSWGTTGVADALYDMRVLVTDNAGNSTASATVSGRRVDNNGPTLSLADPGSPVRGSVTLTATASDPAGVASVVFKDRTSPSGTWTTICTAAAAPYTCAWGTAALADGAYDLEAIATDTVGHATTTVVAARTVDNTAPTAVDVQSANGGTVGTMDAGDTLTFSYSEAMAPASLLAGWDGTSTAVTIHVTNGGVKDTLSIWNAAGTTEVALMPAATDLQLNTSWTKATSVLNATMHQSGPNIVVTFGTLVSGKLQTGMNKAASMVWTPSTAATDLAGNPVTAAAVTESGAVDLDF